MNNRQLPFHGTRPSRRQLRAHEDRVTIVVLTAEIQQLRRHQPAPLNGMPNPANRSNLPLMPSDLLADVPGPMTITANITRALYRRSDTPGVPLSLSEARLQLLRQCRFLIMRENPANPLSAVTAQYLTTVACYQCADRINRTHATLIEDLRELGLSTNDATRLPNSLRNSVTIIRPLLAANSQLMDSLLELMDALRSTDTSLEELLEPTVLPPFEHDLPNTHNDQAQEDPHADE